MLVLKKLIFITPSYSGDCLTGWVMRLILDSVPWAYLEIISGLDSVSYSMEDSSQRIIQWPLLIRMSRMASAFKIKEEINL